MLTDDLTNPYILLTPGPLSTSKSVRSAMRYDSCTWDEDYKNIVTSIRESLIQIANCDPTYYTTVLMQGSGTFGIEATLGCSISREHHKVLILENGVYGRRMIEIAKVLGLPHAVYSVPENHVFDPIQLAELLAKDKAITHVAVVHCETTTGILNPIEKLAPVIKSHNKYFILDAMSSFAGIDFDMQQLDIDFLVSSANKCIQGIPGFSFVICKKEALETLCPGNEKSLSLSLYGQWKEMEKDPGKWRFTSPTHAVIAFAQAICELKEEGGVRARENRYRRNQDRLVNGMQENGFEPYIDRALQSPIITSFIAPNCIPGRQVKFEFKKFYHYLKKNGFVIYPGKVTDKDTFRIGTIGHLFLEDVERFLGHVKQYVTG